MGEAYRIRIWAAASRQQSEARLARAARAAKRKQPTADSSASGRIFGVARVFGDGRVALLNRGLTYGQASALAGKMRDAMTEAEFSEDYTYDVRKVGYQSNGRRNKPLPYLP